MANDWYQQASQLAVRFSKTHYEFLGEDLSEYVSARIGDPPSKALYGRLVKEILVAENLVVPVGMATAKKKSAKGRKVTKWRSLMFVGGRDLVPAREQLLSIRIRVNTRKITLDEGLMEAYQLAIGNIGDVA